MAGSLARYSYLSDDGEVYALKCDRSNANAVNSGLDLAGASLVQLPGNIKPRYVLYRSDNGKVTRKCYLMEPVEDVNALPATYSVVVPTSGTTTITVVLKKSFYSGETYSFVPDAEDTALTDSDTATSA